MKLTSKLPDTGITIFSRMTALANAHGAINLSQGFPDFGISADLIEKVHEHMRSGKNQYAPMQGVAAIPPSVFYREKEDHRVLRFCFAKTSQTLEAAAERLCGIRCP
jgi:aspartate/methionine/tyrosine aminotransferase